LFSLAYHGWGRIKLSLGAKFEVPMRTLILPDWSSLPRHAASETATPTPLVGRRAWISGGWFVRVTGVTRNQTRRPFRLRWKNAARGGACVGNV